MRALTKEEVLKIIRERPDEASFCPECFYPLEQIQIGKGTQLTCMSSICENSERYYNLRTKEEIIK